MGDEGKSKTALHSALHDLCQPLTTLQCRLELATLTRTPEAYREAVESGLAECHRLVKAVEIMRETLRGATQETQETEEVKWGH